MRRKLELVGRTSACAECLGPWVENVCRNCGLTLPAGSKREFSNPQLNLSPKIRRVILAGKGYEPPSGDEPEGSDPVELEGKELLGHVFDLANLEGSDPQPEGFCDLNLYMM